MFCPNCGNNVPDNSSVCPNCGSTLKAQTPATAQSEFTAQNVPVRTAAGDYNVLSLSCGIISIVLGTLGAIMFGVIPAVIGIVTGIVAIIFGVMTKKNTNGVKGNAGFVCGIIGLAFSVILAVGCATCACSSSDEYVMNGCIGGSCQAASDARRTANAFYDLFDY